MFKTKIILFLLVVLFGCAKENKQLKNHKIVKVCHWENISWKSDLEICSSGTCYAKHRVCTPSEVKKAPLPHIEEILKDNEECRWEEDFYLDPKCPNGRCVVMNYICGNGCPH